MREIPVLFENDFCMVLDKPAGLPVQGGAGVRHSLDSILSERITPRPFLVHRLDRDTSGVILVAKTKEAAGRFQALFSSPAGRAFSGGASASYVSARPLTADIAGPRLVKRYLAVCAGIPEPAEGVIDIDLDVRGKKKRAGTRYRVLCAGNAGGVSVSLLELELGTGRMHQIRRHLALKGHPLLGDDKYGDFSLNKRLRKEAGLKHLLLHAFRLVIPPAPLLVPAGLDVEASPPEYFSRFAETAFPASQDFFLRSVE